MAKVKFSALISEMRNKLNGSVFSRNRAGNYLRNKVTPVNPQTSFQTAVRALLTAASQAWRTLSVSQRLAWNSAVANFQGTDIFGDVKTPSGINLWNKLYINAGTIGAAPLSVPPSLVSSPEVPSESVSTSTTGAVTVSDPVLNSVPNGMSLVLRMTPSVSAGKNFLKGKARIIAVLAQGTGLPYNASTPYANKFGVITAGEKIGWELSYIDNVTMIEGPKTTGANIN
jgi:hypothetical protein